LNWLRRCSTNFRAATFWSRVLSAVPWAAFDRRPGTNSPTDAPELPDLPDRPSRRVGPGHVLNAGLRERSREAHQGRQSPGAGGDYEASAFFGIGTARGTPAAIVETVNREINAGLSDPKIKARLADMTAVPLNGSPAEFGRLIAAETEKWAKVIKSAGIKAT
jgi:hypothetical protein